MNKFTLGLVAAILLLGGCTKSKQERLIGHWDCNGQQEGMRMSGTVEYVSNGTSNSMIEARGEESGVELQFEMLAQGTWKLNESELLESIDKLTVSRFNVGGEELPPNSFPQEMKDAMVGMSSGSEIIQLDDRVLITKNAGTQMTCSRK